METPKINPNDSAAAKFVNKEVNVDGLKKAPEEKKTVVSQNNLKTIQEDLENEQKIIKIVDNFIQIYGLENVPSAKDFLVDIIRESLRRKNSITFSLNEKKCLDKYLQSLLENQKPEEAVWEIFMLGAARQKTIDEEDCLDCKYNYDENDDDEEDDIA